MKTDYYTEYKLSGEVLQKTATIAPLGKTATNNEY